MQKYYYRVDLYIDLQIAILIHSLTIWNTIAQEDKCMMGDFNIDLSNALTENLMENLDSNNFNKFLYLLISATSSTLIDNIFSNITSKE